MASPLHSDSAVLCKSGHTFTHAGMRYRQLLSRCAGPFRASAGPSIERISRGFPHSWCESRQAQVIQKIGKQSKELKPHSGKRVLVRAGAFVFCERNSGTMRFQVEASPAGTLPVEQAAIMLAMHCLVRGQMPCDYTVLVSPREALLDTVERLADELLEAGHAIRCDRGLTSREHEVFDGVLRNLSNKE